VNEESVDAFDLKAGSPNTDGSMRPKPKYADRISKRVLIVGFAFIALLVFLFLSSLQNMDNKSNTAAKKENKEPVENVPDPHIDEDKVAGSLKSAESPAPPPAPPPVIPQAETIPPPETKPALTPEQQAAEQERLAKAARLSQARLNGLSDKSFESVSGSGAGAIGGASPPVDPLDGIRKDLMTAAKNGGDSNKDPDGEQDEKLAFLKNSEKDSISYHPHMPEPALSRNELKVGSYIPLILETGINSELPGQITARSSEAVYDTATGCRELIPPMTKFIGKYDSKVAIGQSRMLVVWNVAVFPNGDELNLAGMQGYDPSGQAGLNSDVDNHYLRLFGLAFGMSLVTSGTQASVPAPPSSTSGSVAAPSFAQTTQTALAMQYGQLGAQLMGKYMNVQPTLTDKPGERFVIMVPHTIVFRKVWMDRCGG
jgi:type IV secretion system protein VirB10